MPEEHYFLHDDDVELRLNTGTLATPTFLEIKDAEDIKLSLTKDTTERKPRGSKFKLSRGGKKGVKLTFTFLPSRMFEQTQELEIFYNSFLNDEPMQMVLVTMGTGEYTHFELDAWWEVTSLPIETKAGEGVPIPIECVPTDVYNPATNSLVVPTLKINEV